MEKEFQAMILSAGFGMRLRPLTEHIPKSLSPICGKALLHVIIENLFSAGARKIIVNLHHKAKKIIAQTTKYPCARLHFVREQKILGTGGAIFNCRELLIQSDFFVLHNGDIMSDVDLAELIAQHRKNGMTGTLLLTDGTDNKIASIRGKITGIKGFCGNCENRKLLTYTGIAVFNKNVFDFFPQQLEVFPLINVLNNMIEAGTLGAFIPSKIYWNDIGSIEKYFCVHEDIILKKIFSPKWLNKKDKIYPALLKKQMKNPRIKGFLSSSGNCEIREGARLENCILLDGAIVRKNEFRKNEIIGHNFSVHRDSALILSLDIMQNCDFRKTRISSLPEQGSNRRFYRIAENRKTQILMICSNDDADFQRFIKIGKYLDKLALAVPKIFSHSIKSHSVLMEDLGDTTLNRGMENAKNQTTILALLRKTIRFLVEFQNISFKTAEKIIQREFGFEGLRWESEYFRDNFLAKFAMIKVSEFPGIEEEFEHIAENALSSPRILCHRDFQSQNIMLQTGKVRIVDFQGARLGPLTYDLMSLLRDAYTQISETEIDELKEYYFEILSESSLGKKLQLSKMDFMKCTSSAALQRNMQALGAFAFLGLVKGKKSYLSHIPRGLIHLRKSLDAYKFAYGAENVRQFSKILNSIA